MSSHSEELSPVLAAQTRSSIAARAEHIRTELPKLTGFEDPVTRDVVVTSRELRRRGMPTLAPLLPMLLQLSGKPYSLRDYFPFSPLFRTRMPKKLLVKSGRQVAKTLRVSKHNRVMLANGQQVSGKNLKIGDRVVSFDRYKATFGTIVDKIDSGVKDVLRVKTRLGLSLDLATTHPLRTLLGWKTGAELKLGDRLAAARRGGLFGNIATSDRVKLTAYMIGDGCFGLSSNWNFTAAPGQALDEFLTLANDHEQQGVIVREKPDTVALSVCLHRDNDILAWAIEDGLAGCGSLTKFIPAWVFSLNKTATQDFVSRLWATDGSIKLSDGTPSITYTSISKRLAFDLRAMLLKFGIITSVTQKEAAYRDDETGEMVQCNDAYLVRVETRDGWKRFFDNFDVPGKPAVAIPETEENNNRDTLPIEVQELFADIWKTLKGKHGTSLLSAGLRATLKYAPTYGKAREYLKHFEKHCPSHPRLDELRELLAGDVYWDEVVSIEMLGQEPCWDIEVESHHNYVLNGLLSHNSTSLAAQGIVVSNSIPYFNTLYVTPLFDQIRRFSHQYVRQFIETSPVRDLFIGKGTLGSVLHRSFPNRSNLYFSYAFLDAERTRGYSCSRNSMDEIQDIQHEFLEIIHETLSGSPWGLIQYTGTPKSLDNTIEQLWQDSSQAEWYMKCQTGGCGHWNVPSIDYDLFEMIGPWHRDISEKCPGIVCAMCRKPLNPRRGNWVHTFEERRWKFAGYHVPQMIMPMHYANHEKWDILVGKSEGRGNISRTTFLNESCGESSDIGSKLITETELREACVLPWSGKKHEEARKHLHQYTNIICAVDWGGGGGRVSQAKDAKSEDKRMRTSFTSIAVLGRRPDGKIDVIWGYRSPRTHDWEWEARLVLEVIVKFKCSHLVHDYGGAGTGREVLIRQAGFPLENIIPMKYHGSASHNIMVLHPATDDHPRDWYSVDKSRSLVTTAQCIKHGLIRFFEYDRLDADNPGLIGDFLALIEEKITSRIGTDAYYITSNPTRSDDFAQAVNIGCCALWYMNEDWPDVAAAAMFKLPAHIIQSFGPRAEIDWNEMY